MTPQTVAHQVPLSIRYSRQEYCSGLPFPSPWDLSDSGLEPTSPVSPALAGRFFTTDPLGKPGECSMLHPNSGDASKDQNLGIDGFPKMIILGSFQALGWQEGWIKTGVLTER